MKKIFSCLLLVLLAVCIITPNTANAAASAVNTKLKQKVTATGQYNNFDGVPTVAQFTDEKGEFCFAYVTDNKLIVIKTESGKVKDKVKLKLKGETFGTIVCDTEGNYFVVTGTANTGDDTDKKTVFITKYKSEGTLIKTVGDNGRSSLASYYGDKYNTKEPFSYGTCDATINENFMAVYYGRVMYSGHQSCSAWMIDTETMETVKPDIGTKYSYLNYESHSFAQRVIAYEGGFAYMSEGDCYERAFTFNLADLATNKTVESPVFDFYVKKGTYDAYDMRILNNNFAHMGNICNLGNGNISFVASSVKAMSSKAEKQSEQIFIQIFDPSKDLKQESAYITTGKRSGIAGKNGDQNKTNYGVKWLTSYKSGKIANPQAVADADGNTYVLYERYDKNNQYLGIYRITVDAKGNVTQKTKKISKTAHLNSCETPILIDDAIYWCGNKDRDYDYNLYVFKYAVK